MIPLTEKSSWQVYSKIEMKYRQVFTKNESKRKYFSKWKRGGANFVIQPETIAFSPVN